jgi:hypothetical protein
MKIKIVLFVVACMLVLSETAFAQAKVNLGAKAGVNISNISFEDADDKNLVAGFAGGLFANMPLSEEFSVQPELLFSQKGTKYSLESNLLDTEVTLKLNYIEVPVNLVYNLARDFDFQLGPYIGFLAGTKADGKITIGNNTYEASDEIDIDKFNKVDFGLQGGLRFFLNPVYLGFTYKYGLSQVAKEGEYTHDILGKGGNRTIQLYAGIPFSIFAK